MQETKKNRKDLVRLHETDFFNELHFIEKNKDNGKGSARSQLPNRKIIIFSQKCHKQSSKSLRGSWQVLGYKSLHKKIQKNTLNPVSHGHD